MKISTSMDYGATLGLTYPETAGIMKKAGYEGVDLSMAHNGYDPAGVLTQTWADEVRMMAAAARNAGLEIPQCHLPYYPGHLELPGDGTAATFEAQFLPAYEIALKMCGEIGCPVAVMHPFTVSVKEHPEETLEGNVHLIRQLLPLLEEYHVQLALENGFCYRQQKYYTGFEATPEELLPMLDGVGSEHVGICLDTGHANIFRMHIGNVAREYGSRLIALHVHGNAGHDEHCVPGSLPMWCGKLDFDDFSAALGEIGFEGYYNLEINPGKIPIRGIRPYYEYTAAVAKMYAEMAEKKRLS